MTNMAMPRLQYHGTTADRLAGIIRYGLTPLAKSATMKHQTRAIFTADRIEHAALYGDGTIVVVMVDPKARYLTRSMSRSMRRGEFLIDSVERWMREASAKGYAGVRVADQQSAVGNITIDPSVLSVAQVIHPR